MKAMWLDVFGLAVLGMLIQSMKPTQASRDLMLLNSKLDLLNVHRKLIENLNEYANKLQEKLDTLRRIALELESPLLLAKDPEMEFLSNPLHGYSLIRQMHFDWPTVEKFMEQGVGLEEIEFVKEMSDELPKLEDVKEAAAAMFRVQEVYKLEAADIANGLLDGLQLNAKLSISDCYEMGSNLFDASLFLASASWLYVARDLWDQSPTTHFALLNVPRSDISSLLAKSEMASGNEDLARAALTGEVSLRDQADQLLLVYQNYTAPTVEEHPYIDEMEEEFTEYCGSPYQAEPSRLVCSYKTGPSKFLHLAPFKMEQLSDDPFVAAFHDVVSESEVKNLNRLSEPLLCRSRVVNEDNKDGETMKARTVNGAFLDVEELTPTEGQLVKRILQRMTDMSDLWLKDYSMEYLKYDFGGHYNLHEDYFNYTDETLLDDRLATFLIYLNDVPRGGATIFPDLKLAVHPERGKAVYWYNMNPNSFDFEPRSIHGACPVLVGQKIALAYWVHELNQMFVKPCLQPPISRT